VSLRSLPVQDVAVGRAENWCRTDYLWGSFHVPRCPAIFRWRTPGSRKYSVPLRPSSDHWTAKNILLFREETKAARNNMFFGWNPIGISQMALCWNASRDLRLSQSVWRLLPCDHNLPSAVAFHRNVAISTLRQGGGGPCCWLANFRSITILQKELLHMSFVKFFIDYPEVR